MSPDSADQQTLLCRKHAADLADSPGWLHWALPLLLTEIAALEKTILEVETVPVDELLRARAKRSALAGFLDKLHAQAKGACETMLASIPVAENYAHDRRQQILEAFLRRPVDITTTAPPPPPPPVNDTATDYSPFAGSPTPLRKPNSAPQTP
jgi:hypothetical protein